MRLTAVILAAGQGTRMKSELPKVLHPLAGRPLVEYAVETATAVTGAAPVLVVGHGSDQVRQVLGDRARYVLQAQQLGTGHAVMQARALLLGQADAILVAYADMPLLTETTLRAIVAGYEQRDGVMSFLTVVAQDPRGFGRVARDEAGRPQGVVEEASCTPAQLSIRELNAGVYCFNAAWLWENLPQIPLSPKGEYYLTDMVALAVSQGCTAVAVQTTDEAELIGINTRVHLAEAEHALRARVNRRWMEAGVTLPDPATTYIEPTVQIGRDTTVLPGTHLQGCTTIGSGCRIGPHTVIVDSQIGDRCAVMMSVVEEAAMEADASIGPFGHLRRGARLCQGAHMGNFGEMKNSTLGPGSKMGHFSYLGDATVGAGVNIGAGAITCNFDGERKHPTVIEDGAFIGSDSMLVAPVHIGQGARTGAGSVVTHDVPAGAIVYGTPARLKKPVGES
ncbi:MAG: bifunctional UDP-N-acetylglucosamine pyrophosphorylase / glucosamine-phosphate N-acetyltransferase [Chloroflexota bacterium]|nr:bifunctional UDP-N-acetylglucosamine pyrophosphorylase / glucosamine-phosphate N-acetyltransferase [Chloroflexota bacterium]